MTDALTRALLNGQHATPETPAEVLATKKLIPQLQSVRDRLMSFLGPRFGESFDGDMDVLLDTINHMKRLSRSLAAGKVDVSDALAYSRNYATANPSLSATTKEHILGLCNLLERVSTAPPADPAKASGSAPGGWRNVLKRAREGLGAGGALGVPGSRQRELEVEIGGMLLDHIEDGLGALTATPPASASEVTDALGWLRSALDCPTFAWDADQRAAAEAALTAALQQEGKSHE